MSMRVLRYKDGFAEHSPELRAEVRTAQDLLRAAGYFVSVDGLFGDKMETAVKAFQREAGLEVDGVIDGQVWKVLLKSPVKAEESPELAGFRGELEWVHAREGHAGKPYWPGGESGVTFDPGVDLGYAEPVLVKQAYQPRLEAAQMQAAEKVLGLRGAAAEQALNADPVLGTVRISRAQAGAIFPFIARPYWVAISQRFPVLTAVGTPPEVQTALLSLAYNRGASNRGLEPLAQPLAAGDWLEVAERIGAMQQDHALEGIRERRRMEAGLIRAGLNQ